MPVRRCYETQLDESRSVALGYDPEGDNYLIVGKTNGEERRMCLSQDAMWAIENMYIRLLKYQAQTGMDGIGNEL